MHRLDIEGEKRCPVCGRKVYEPHKTFCSGRCSDKDRQSAQAHTAREVEVLMRQYRAGNWTPVD